MEAPRDSLVRKVRNHVKKVQLDHSFDLTSRLSAVERRIIKQLLVGRVVQNWHFVYLVRLCSNIYSVHSSRFGVHHSFCYVRFREVLWLL